MKKIFLILLLIIAVIACKSDKKETKNGLESNYPIQNENEKSILDFEYLNDTLNIAVKDFKVIDHNDDNYELEITMETPEIDKYSKGHKFFVHCFYYDNLNVGNNDRLAVGTNRIKVEGKKIIFSRKFQSKVYEFKRIRYGLLNNETKERYFSLKLDSITIID